MSFTRFAFIPLFGVAVLAHGAHQLATLLGKWKVKSISAPVAGPQTEKAKAMMMAATIQFSKHKTFALNLVGSMKGTWKVTGHDVAPTITEMIGKKMSEIVAMA